MEMSDQQALEMIMGLGLGFVLLIFVVYLVIRGLFLYSMFKVLQNCGVHAKLSPGLVFIAMIPLLIDAVMFIIIAIKLPESIAEKYKAHGVTDPGDGTKTIGLIFAISFAAQWIPIVNMVAWIVALVTWIIYWVKLSGYNNQLPHLQGEAAPAV